MIEYYPQIKAFHIGIALASGALFLLRALAVNLGARWGMAAPLRFLSYAIDTALLTAAFMLMSITHQYPFVQPWLTVKVLLVVVYIVLGSLALKRAPPGRWRIASSVAAVLVLAMIYSIARTHSPWGPLAQAAAEAIR